LSEKAQYYKYYITLLEEDKDFGLSGPPKGSVRFEIKGEQCNIDLNVINLKPCAPGYSYKCFLICPDQNNFHTACIGDIEVSKEKSNLKTTFSGLNADNAGISFDRYNIVALTYQPQSNYSGEKILFPLVGYRGEKIPWKNRFNLNLQRKKESEEVLDGRDNLDVHNSDVDEPYLDCLSDGLSEYYNKDSQIKTTEQPVCNDSFNECTYSTYTLDRIKTLDNMLSMSFSVCKPFSISDNSTKWWKIQNHQLLKRILYSIGYPNLILMSNYLNTSYYIYGYYIVGINVFDHTYQFTFGIPSLYGIDPNPHNLPCTWKPENSNGELYGEFGYWLIKFDMVI